MENLGNSTFILLLVFYLLLLIAGAIYFVVLGNFRNKEKLSDLRNDWTNKLHNDIGGDLSSVSLRLDSLKRKLEPLEPEIKNDVLKTYAILNSIQKKLRFVFDLIDPKKSSLHVMLDDVHSFAKENFSIKDISFHYSNQLNPEADYGLDIGRVNKLYLAMKELVNNCVKYSKANNASISIRSIKEGLTIEITDDGIGFDKKASNHQGNGLNNLYQYVEEGCMDMKIDSTPGEGTKISLFVPDL